MKLKEFEAKQLFEEVGIPISKGILVSTVDDVPHFNQELLLKVQTMAGSRGKAGGIVTVKSQDEAKEVASSFLNKIFLNEMITEVLLDEKIEISKELYLGIMFDTSKRTPVLIFSEEGGIDIEALKKNNPEKIVLMEIDYLEGLDEEGIGKITSDERLKEIMKKLYSCFVKFDCKMLEINPLVVTTENNLVAVDAVAVLDDDANYRREISFSERTDNRKATSREVAARMIDKDDYRGVAGKTFLDLEGDIAILTSGGGASMTLMDALVEYGGRPANFTEYSGNPPAEKVEKLTRVVLDRKNLSGLLVAGVIANFTNIAETLGGILTVLKEQKPDFPIVIRRAGPHDEEAREMLMKAKEEYGLDIHFYDEKIPLTKAVEIMVDLSNEYKSGKLKAN
ncbi:MAG: ATP-grasp domain-containing protein [Nanoarchaeota archaeon]|nr:acetate--CoA ligase family protein [Nanoarchaeota archaeon]